MITPALMDRHIFDLVKSRVPFGLRTGRPLMAVCSYCPDAFQRTAEAHAQGYDVTHVICPACVAKMEQEMSR